uniref:hypothetical protein n=1 Tax=Thaumasiovibrio occultus TaxID=1891184 RepID=UPI000B352DE6|nr:hypothetical protein [Thaumasiovibrio occultus]
MKFNAADLAKNGARIVVGLITCSLFFVTGLITLGACMLAGVAAVIMAKWHLRQTPNDVANPVSGHQNDDPVVVV